jgi:SAM-dependent methyltransferase
MLSTLESDTDAHSSLPAGEYVKRVTSLASDRLTRSAFQQLVLRIAAPGCVLFDFGAGPGIDARYFAERGFPVEAYDIDPKMREHFQVYCREFIERGQIRLDCSSYPEFLAGAAAARDASLVVSNFAPLSLVEDLRALFAKFHAITAPDGKVLASVLNPCPRVYLRQRWWWQTAMPQLWRDGQFCSPGPQGPVYRRTLAYLRAHAWPHFTLRRVYRCRPAVSAGRADGFDVSRGSGLAWLKLLRCNFMFVLFEKRASGQS